MTSFHEEQRAAEAAGTWPGVDLAELVPRSVAYREAYSKLARWASEQTAITYAEQQRSRLPVAWQQAGYRAAAKIAEEIYVHMGNAARRYASLLPADPEHVSKPIVDVDLPEAQR